MDERELEADGFEREQVYEYFDGGKWWNSGINSSRQDEIQQIKKAGFPLRRVVTYRKIEEL